MKRFLAMSLRLSLGLSLGLSALPAMAAPFGSFDARSAGMGDVGVATSNLDNAAFFNPALLAGNSGTKSYALLLPAVGARLGDPDGLVDDIKDFQDAYNAGNLATANTVFNRALNKSALANANVGAAFAHRGDTWAWALVYNRYARLGVTPSGTNALNAQLLARGYQATEVGLALSRKFGALSVGIVPKAVSVKTYDYAKPLDQVDTGTSGIIDTLNEKDNGSTTNVDVGLAYDFGGGFHAGVVGRNLSAKRYTTLLGNTIKLDPQYRAGLAYTGGTFTLGVDYDLSDNDPVSFDQKTRMLAAGLEVNLFDTAQLRLGYAQNTADTGNQTKQDYYSAGLGLSPFGVHLDLAVSGNSKDIGAYAQLGFRF